MATCSGCDSTWTGAAMAHCTSCHRTFSTVSNFDRHRKDGVCKNPARLGMKQNSRGTWLMDGEKDISEIHRKRGK